MGQTARLIFLGVVSALLLVMVGMGVGWLAAGGLGGGAPRAAVSSPARQPVPPMGLPASPVAAFTPKPTFTPLPSPTALPVTTAPLTPTATVLEEGVVLFHVQAPTVELYQGPGAGYPALGSAAQSETLPVVGRTADGLWWMVCCVEGQPGWMALESGNVLVEGDVARVNVLDVEVRP